MFNEEVYHDMMQRVEHRYRRRVAWLANLALYIFVTFLIAHRLLPEWIYEIPLVRLTGVGWLLWTTLLALHLLTVILYEFRDRKVEFELMRQLLATGSAGYAKPKRKHNRLALTEDGELLEVAEDEWFTEEKHKR